MGQRRPSFASSLVTHVLSNLSEEHPTATRRALQFASYAGSLFSRGNQSTNSDALSLWSRYKPSIYLSKSLGATESSVSDFQHTLERLAARYKPSDRLTMGTYTSLCPTQTQCSPRIEAHPTQTTAFTDTESSSATMSEKPSVSAVLPSYEDLDPTKFATTDSLQEAKRPTDPPSCSEQYHSSKSVSFADTSLADSYCPQNKSKTSSCSRGSSPPKRPGDMDAKLNAYPVEDGPAGSDGPCLTGCGGPAVDGMEGAGSDLKLGDIDVGGGGFTVGDCGIQ
jgi:hypothetical protein